METDKPPADLDESVKRGHESSRLSLRGMIIFLIVFLSAALVLHVLLAWLLGVLVAQEPKPQVSPLADRDAAPPEPRLQGSRVHPELPHMDLARMRAREEAMLNQYEWVDRENGVAKIPIERAMTLLAERNIAATRPGSGQNLNSTGGGQPR